MNQIQVDKTPIASDKIKAGDLMAFVYWVKVENVLQNGLQLTVKDIDSGTAFNIQGKELIERGSSADQYNDSYKVSKTQAAEKLISAHNRPITVNFLKADGSERTMRCRLLRPEPLLGRSMVEDLEAPDRHVKQVDHRTIQWMIVDNVRYEVK